GAVRHPQVQAVDDEQRLLADRGQISQGEAVDGADGFHAGRPLPRAVGPPELVTAGIREVGDEEQAVSRLLDAAGGGTAQARAEVPHPPLAPWRAVAHPQLLAREAVVRLEKDPSRTDRDRGWQRVAAPGA